MPPFRAYDKPPKTVEGFRAKSNLGDTKSLLADAAISLKDKQNIVFGTARTGTDLVLLNDGRVDVATRIDGTSVLPPLNVDNAKHYFGEVKGYPGISDVVEILEHGVPVVTSSTPTDPRQALQYGNHSSVQEHSCTVWEKLCEDVRWNRCLIFTRGRRQNSWATCSPLGSCGHPQS